MPASRGTAARPDPIDPRPLTASSTATASSRRGRHRKPKAPSRTRRAAVVVGAGVAIPLAGAGTADAATTKTWDRLAQCESGGNWKINTGNGYYGGLQFSPATWRGFGGGAFAARADLASRVEQITIAEKVLDTQGWRAWPACSRKLGLDRSDAQGTPSVMQDRAEREAGARRAKAEAHEAKAAEAARAEQARAEAAEQAAPQDTATPAGGALGAITGLLGSSPTSL